MNTSLRWMAPAVGLVIALFSSNGVSLAQTTPRTVHPGAPGQVSRVPAAEGGGREVRHTEADVQFMQGMIPHHAQALEMTSLVPARSAREDVRLLAQRIEAAQDHEIAVMQRWLRARGEEVPDATAEHHGHGAGHHALMPGMLTGEEMARLAAATGAEFDRLFLEGMIRHHEGALTMVAELFSSAGAGQEWEIFQLASGVDGDQRIEIARMYRMLADVR